MNRDASVVIGLLGTTLDLGKHPDRWQNWRPSVALCRQPDLIIERFELLHGSREKPLAEIVSRDISAVSPETEMRLHQIDFGDPWDFEQVYEALFNFARGYPFDTDSENYLIHITTGTHVAQICLFLLTESRWLPGRLIQCSPERDRSAPGTVKVIDLDLSRYDRIASRFQQEQREGVSYLKGGIETRNSAFNQLIDRIERVAITTRDPLLLTGPTGAGKSRLARRIYELKKARHAVKGEFVDVNCATLRGDGAVSTLFGHTKGAFTGALKDRAGLLRTAEAVSCSWMKSASLDRTSKPCFCARSKKRRFSRWDRTARAVVISNSSPGPIGICSPPSVKAGSERICWRGSTCGHSPCPASSRGPKISSPIFNSNSISTPRRPVITSHSARKLANAFWISRCLQPLRGRETSAT